MAVQQQREVIYRRSEGQGSVITLENCKDIMLSMEGGRKGCLPFNAVISKIEELKKRFVETEVMKKAALVLERCDQVTLTGAPGEGKTSIALMLCEKYHCSNYEIVFVDDLDSFNEEMFCPIMSNTFFVLDDLFGTIDFSTNVQKLDNILTGINDMIQRRVNKREVNTPDARAATETDKLPVAKVKVVITSKTFNLKEGRAKLPQFNLNLFKEDTIVNLSEEGFSSESKRELIQRLREEYPEVDLKDDDIADIVSNKNSMFGFPLIVKLYFSEPLYQLQGVRFFKEPLPYIRRNIDGIVREGNSRSVILILLVLNGGKVDLLSLQVNPEDVLTKDIIMALGQILPTGKMAVFDVYKEAKNFKGTYLQIEDEFASFSHPSICDAVTYAMVDRYPYLLLKYCPLQFLFERVRLNRRHEKGELFVDPGTNFVYLTPRYAERLITRLSDHMKRRYFRLTITHPMFKDQDCVFELYAKMGKNLHEISHQRDIESGDSFLYYCTVSKNDYMLEQILKLKNLDKSQIEESIKASVKCGNFSALTRLMKYKETHGRKNIPAISYKLKLIPLAAKFGHKDIFTYLQDNEVDMKTKDEDGKTVLHLACEGGHLNIFDMIPKERLRELLDAEDFSLKTALMVCASAGHLQLFEHLLASGAELTPACLQFASMKGHLNIVKYIVTKNKDSLNECLRYGRTPVMLAARFGRDDTFEYLARCNCDMFLTDDFNDNILHLAVFGGSSAIVESVLSLPSMDIDVCGNHNRTAVMIAAQNGHGQIFEKLHSRKACISLLDSMKNTCLHLTCYGGNMNICTTLLGLQKNLIKSRNVSGRTPILLAALKGFMDIVKLLVKNGANPKDTDSVNNNCLHLACHSGNTHLVKFLLREKDFGFDVNAQGRLGWTPLMGSAMFGHEHILKSRLLHQTDFKTKDDNNNDLLWAACWSGNKSLVLRMLSLSDFNSAQKVNRRGENGWTPIMIAAEKGHKEVFEVLLQYEAATNLTDDHGNDCLSLAAAGGNVFILKYLLSINYFKQHINKRGNYGWTPVMVASRQANKAAVQLLVEEGANTSWVDHEHNSCLSLASMGTGGEVVPYLLSLKGTVLNSKGSQSRTPLLIAASSGNVQAFKALTSQNADVSVTDNQGNDCLALAAEGGSVSIVRYLLNQRKFDVNRKGYKNRTPIMQAIAGGHYKVFKMLTKEGASSNKKDDEQNDCLILAVRGGSIRIVKHLLSLTKSAINRKGGDDMTPVLTAARYGQQMIFDILVEEKADLKAKDKFRNNILILASSGGNESIVTYLITNKICDINSRGQFGWTPLMAASSNGHRQVFDLLKQAEAQLQVKVENHDSCLALASISGHSDLVRYLLPLFDINSRGKDGRTPVMHALLQGHVKTFFVLVTAGADLTLTDSTNTSCSQLAEKGRNQSIINYFLNLKGKKQHGGLLSCVRPH